MRTAYATEDRRRLLTRRQETMIAQTNHRRALADACREQVQIERELDVRHTGWRESQT